MFYNFDSLIIITKKAMRNLKEIKINIENKHLNNTSNTSNLINNLNSDL